MLYLKGIRTNHYTRTRSTTDSNVCLYTANTDLFVRVLQNMLENKILNIRPFVVFAEHVLR